LAANLTGTAAINLGNGHFASPSAIDSVFIFCSHRHIRIQEVNASEGTEKSEAASAASLEAAVIEAIATCGGMCGRLCALR
jgi:hypothetical protein